jgi:hypothetical protein
LRFRFLDSKDFILSGRTAEEEVSFVLFFLFFEDFLRGALGGAAEQLATATAGAFLSMPRWRE